MDDDESPRAIRPRKRLRRVYESEEEEEEEEQPDQSQSQQFSQSQLSASQDTVDMMVGLGDGEEAHSINDEEPSGDHAEMKQPPNEQWCYEVWMQRVTEAAPAEITGMIRDMYEKEGDDSRYEDKDPAKQIGVLATDLFDEHLSVDIEGGLATPIDMICADADHIFIQLQSLYVAYFRAYPESSPFEPTEVCATYTFGTKSTTLSLL